jgi:hypothetical protein
MILRNFQLPILQFSNNDQLLNFQTVRYILEIRIWKLFVKLKIDH